jgi:hypothetical protein
MTKAIADCTVNVRADQPQRQRALRVVPVLGVSGTEPGYRLMEDKALDAVKVSEISNAGSVPSLQIQNSLDERIFLMDGQELIGAKQNRILNTDVLVPARATLTIPVSCVEAGRWSHVSENFSPGKAASHNVRAHKQARVHDSLKASGSHDADQSQVWAEVAETMVSANASSPTAALHDAYLERETDFKAFRASLVMPSDAVGLAVFHGKHLLGLDIFDRHSTLQYFWESLLDSYAIDWLQTPESESKEQAELETSVITKTLERAAAADWENFASPGEGRDYRVQEKSWTGSALVWEERTVIHLQIFPKTARSQPRRRPRIHRVY